MVPEKYVKIIQEMNRNVYTSVRSCVGETGGFEIGVGLHQGSALSPFIFNIVMDVMTKDVWETVPWCILYADDIVLCSERREDITEDGGNSMRLDAEEIKRVQKFKYLGSILEDSGSMDQEVRHRIHAGWNNWRSASGVLCDKKVLLKLKGKFHKTVVRSAMLYGTETASMRKTEERTMDVAEMRMLR
ncbi:uncharacterized protein LOC135226253 [Macrobrachium nipponense]|uniref:uncharacterized protein LOC135226253 n=1 Tax=Macrobrachium nipponense TaxID=159736 RepID=UPI0030C8A97E